VKPCVKKEKKKKNCIVSLTFALGLVQKNWDRILPELSDSTKTFPVIDEWWHLIYVFPGSLSPTQYLLHIRFNDSKFTGGKN
jgi:hypothetical protein